MSTDGNLAANGELGTSWRLAAARTLQRLLVIRQQTSGSFRPYTPPKETQALGEQSVSHTKPRLVRTMSLLTEITALSTINRAPGTTAEQATVTSVWANVVCTCVITVCARIQTVVRAPSDRIGKQAY